MALARFGGRRINDFTDNSETSNEVIQCRIHFDLARRALIRSHPWGFARKRVQLSQTTTPDFEWDYAYLLPVDCLRVIDVYDDSDNPTGATESSYAIENGRLLFNGSTCYLRYVRDVTDPAKWDPLFLDLFVLVLAQKLVIPLSQDLKLKQDIGNDIKEIMPAVRATDRNESIHLGRDALKPWREGRFSNTA
jgi:hypothetical protein